jgi:hypothetical protein
MDPHQNELVVISLRLLVEGRDIMPGSDISGIQNLLV